MGISAIAAVTAHDVVLTIDPDAVSGSLRTTNDTCFHANVMQYNLSSNYPVYIHLTILCDDMLRLLAVCSDYSAACCTCFAFVPALLPSAGKAFLPSVGYESGCPDPRLGPQPPPHRFKGHWGLERKRSVLWLALPGGIRWSLYPPTRYTIVHPGLIAAQRGRVGHAGIPTRNLSI